MPFETEMFNYFNINKINEKCDINSRVFKFLDIIFNSPFLENVCISY